VDAGEVLVASGEDGVVDEVQGVTAMSNAWASGSIASCGDVEGWLETVVTSAMVGGVDSLQK
jgi:hypothetical protein